MYLKSHSIYIFLVALIGTCLSFGSLAAPLLASGTIQATISCSHTPIYDQFNPTKIVGYSTSATGSNDQNAPGFISGGPTTLGPEGGNYSYTYAVNQIPGFAGTQESCAGFAPSASNDGNPDGTPPPVSPPNPPPAGPPPPVNPPPAGSCPSSFIAVFLSSSEVVVGDSVTAFAPDGWTGGQFVIENPSVAKVTDLNGSSAKIVGLKKGVVSVSGKGWNLPNGATGCNLSGAILSVRGDAVGLLDAPSSISVCKGNTVGNLVLRANANVFSEVRIFGAAGVSDNSVIVSVPANTLATYNTGDIIKNGTTLKLIAPFDGNLELGKVTVSVQEKDCSNEEGSNIKLESAAVYNTKTVPSNISQSYGEVPCGELLAVWKLAANSAAVEGFRIINTTSGMTLVVSDPKADHLGFLPSQLSGAGSPQSLYSYAIEAFAGGKTSRLPAGQVAVVWPCGPDLNQSNQDIVSVRGVSIFSPAHIRNFQSDAEVAKVMPIAENDQVSFRVHIVNGGTADYTEEISMKILLTGLGPVNAKKELDWGARVLCGDSQVECKDLRVSSTSYVRGSNTLSFILEPQGGKTLPSGGVWSVEFTGKTVAPLGSGEIFRMQSTAYLNGFTSSALKTPVIPVVRNLGVPKYEEIR